MITIYHNPRCSKSRAALQLLEQVATSRQLTLNVIDYLNNPPDVAQVATLHQLLGGELMQMVRSDEPDWQELVLANADQAAIYAAIAARPRLLQRPLAVYQQRAVIGRPPEQVLSLFQENAA